MPTKPILLLLCLIAGITGSAQLKKGTRLLGATIGTGSFSGGTTSFSYPSSAGFNASSSQFNVLLTPSYGVFVSNDVVVGGTISIASSYQKVDQKSLRDTTFASNKSNTTDFGVGGYLRYYLTTSRSLSPFLQVFANGGTGIGSNSGFLFGTDIGGSYRESYEGKTASRIFLNSGLNIGFTKLLNQHVGLDFFAGYTYSYVKFTNETSSTRDYTNGTPDVLQKFEPTQRYTGHGVNVGVGVQVLL